MKFVPNAVTKTVASTALRAQYHSPTLLLVGGVVGVGATVVLACKATLKADVVLKEAEKDQQTIEAITVLDNNKPYTDADRKHDLRLYNFKTSVKIAKLYAPAAVVGVVSVAALTQSNRILTQRNVALTAAYATIEKAFNDYRQRVRNELGKQKDEEFYYGVDKREVVIETDSGPKVVVDEKAATASGYAKFFDQFNPNWQPNAELNLYWLKCQQQWLNNKLEANGHLFLNDVYTQLGFEKTDAGQVVGWWIGPDSKGDGFVDFGIFDANNEQAREFVNGYEKAILLDFNHEGVIYNKLARRS